jgi:uncharacterized protein (DUF433 family)
MSQLTTAETIPLEMDAEGVIRVSNTRVTLDTIVQAFSQGATPEEIAQQYPTVPLADIYFVIGYVLRRSDHVDAYIQRRSRQAEEVRRENESRCHPIGVRERLLARRTLRSNTTKKGVSR